MFDSFKIKYTVRCLCMCVCVHFAVVCVCFLSLRLQFWLDWFTKKKQMLWQINRKTLFKPTYGGLFNVTLMSLCVYLICSCVFFVFSLCLIFHQNLLMAEFMLITITLLIALSIECKSCSKKNRTVQANAKCMRGKKY